MGFPSYRGEVTTVHHVMMLHACVNIRCEQCGHTTRRWAFRLYQLKEEIWKLPLGKPVKGFWCRAHRGSATVVLSCADQIHRQR